MLRLESSWHGRSVEHVLTYSGRQIAVGSHKPSRITRQKTCCASESNTSVGVVFANRSGFDAPIGVVLAWEERGSCLNIFRTTNRGRISETFTNFVAKDLLRKSVDHVLTYSRQQIAVESQKPSRITRQKTCCASESTRRFANRSGFDAPIGVVLAWEERGSCLYIFRITNRSRISETFTNYEAKDLLHKNLHELLGKRLVAQMSQTRRLVNRSGFDAPIGVVLAWEERGSCLNIFRLTNRDRISETFMNYEAKDLLRKRKIAVGSQKPSRITRQNTCCACESNTSVRVVFANRSGFDAPIGVVLAWEERGSCLNIFRTTNCGRISETFTNYEAKDLLRKSVDHVLTYSGRQIAVGSQKPSRITRQKTCCASETNTSVRVVFANRSGFDAPIGVVLAWEERGSCLNIFWTTNHGQISETITNYEAKDLLRKNLHELRGKRLVTQVSQTRRFANRSGFDAPIGVVLAWEQCGSCLNIFRTTNRGRISETFTNYEAKDSLRKSVDHVLTYFGRQIAVGSQKPSRTTWQKTCCASESNTWVRVVFPNRSGFDGPIGVVLAWEERGSCLNIFRTTNRGRISETFTNYEAKDLLRKSRHGMGGAWIMSQHILDDKSLLDLRNLNELRGIRLDAQVSQTRRFALYSRTGVVLMLRLESSWHGKSVDHVLTYFGRQIAVGSQTPSRITRQKTCCARESNRSIRVVFANRSGFDAPIGVVLAWEERGSCLTIFQTKNRGRISETFTNYEAKDLLRKTVDHVLTYSGRQIAVRSQKPSRITRQTICCATESNTSVRVVFANRSGFDAPIGVVLAWE
ncbi:uncharacterized protein G2W53_009852 [Senna tora]|uniref:Uncharacterized protein n=1 Tax=Senna tora TaxID=362788 RepID=A0A834WZ34_9FABA|nr:uncharacterized protein G2W53_009852 [Senna tora]